MNAEDMDRFAALEARVTALENCDALKVDAAPAEAPAIPHDVAGGDDPTGEPGDADATDDGLGGGA